MEIKHLRHFVAVAEEKSITKAAERLFIAQPGLSQQIRSLEREIGTPLFVRLSRGVELTEAGSFLLEPARAAITAFDEAAAACRQLGGERIGLVRLGFSPVARDGVTPRVLSALSADGVTASVSVLEAHGGPLLERLRAAELDAAIVIGPVRDPRLGSEPLSAEPAVVLVSDSDPLAAQPRLRGEQLADRVVSIVGQPGSEGYDEVAGSALGEATRTHAVGHYSRVLTAPLEGLVSVVPASVHPPPGTTACELEAAPEFRFTVVWRRNQPPPVLRPLVDAGGGRGRATPRHRHQPPAHHRTAGR